MVIPRTEKMTKRYSDIESRKAEAKLASEHRHLVVNSQSLSFEEKVQSNMDRQARIYSKPRLLVLCPSACLSVHVGMYFFFKTERL